MSRSTTAVVAAGSLLLLTWIAVAVSHASIAADLGQRVGQALQAHAIGGLQIDVDGRDVRIRGELPRQVTAADVARIAGDVWGVRVVDVGGLYPPRSLVDPADPLRPRFDASKIERFGGDLIIKQSPGGP